MNTLNFGIILEVKCTQYRLRISDKEFRPAIIIFRCLDFLEL
jgi:hypothetical protein